jgi:hypothetical protein
MADHQIEILDVTFLTPAIVKAKIDDQEVSVQVSIDIVNRRVYPSVSHTKEFYSEEIFAYLDEVNTLPDDFFMAPDSIIEQATNAQEAHEQLRQQQGV